MAAFLIFMCFASVLSSSFSSPLPTNASVATVQDPGHVIQDVVRNIDVSLRRRMLGNCGTGNPIDDCWRCDPNWSNNRQRLADCAVGFGRAAIGGKDGKVYVVTDPSDNPANPEPGTLRYGIVQDEPLWITFARDMTIRPKKDLLVGSHKTIDGRGADVVVGDGGACFAVRGRSNVIIHGITIRDCRKGEEGDGVTVLGSTDVWIDHCTLEDCIDGLIDVTEGSTRVTLSNNLLRNHDKVMLLGHSDTFSEDRNMKVTVAFNRFGPGLVQRMPRRCRFGHFHIVNNDYVGWEMYAIGGSASPTILSQGNRFLADKAKEGPSSTNNKADEQLGDDEILGIDNDYVDLVDNID
ncbi:hypothetical protein QOZ80_5AG0400120 [Eleusine coracana subsp. coracana]|nr:hypothetical protein QOZ80_5AG0400120 [Eleusine coracana subsp. coracana]